MKKKNEKKEALALALLVLEQVETVAFVGECVEIEWWW